MAYSSPRLEIFCIFFVSSSIFILPLSESTYFKFDSFSQDTKNIAYSGDAAPSYGVIELNQVEYKMHVGHAKYADPVQIWDRKSSRLSDFTTHFTFKVDTEGQSLYGDCFAFFLAPVSFQIPANSAGEFIGLFNRTNNGSPQNQIIVFEFDSVINSQDPAYQHAGINLNSIKSVTNTAWNASFHSGHAANVSVSYNATTQMMIMSWRYATDLENTTSLSYRVDLRDVLPEWVTLGFSGSTGCVAERHILEYWEFSSSLNTAQKREDSPKKWKPALGITIPISIVIVVVTVAYVMFRRRNGKSGHNSLETNALTSMTDDLERGTGPKRFSFRDLALATNNFSDDLKLGEGGFGCVYKGYLSHEGMVVAVKKISQGSKQGKKEYITEVKIISSLRHRNLVQLIGWCHDQTQFLLVYEFLPNASLDYYLFSKKSPLEWGVRYKIVMGLASALLYLHEECEQCVLHRDIKASNIMLDSGFNPKLGDFGLARLMDHELGFRTTGLAGTLGYMSPEYVTTGKASKESDVYSFGVVALEIACGRKAMDRVDPNSDLGLVHWVWDLLGKDELLSSVDSMLNNVYDKKEAECLMRVGLWCAHPDSRLRPSISQAIKVLKFEAALPNLPMKILVPMYNATPDVLEASSASGTMTNNSINEVR
ncbi:legume lectin, alpha chain, conserved site [Artemisia annua]|uniref:Legume lectin, alpha chain, conserved site n=1 Tax=Artemisia annua TaxID=35608 RepID=A0A2U1QDU1_ARTAN|nr:legume lectin, alpha chain, conserved site [Artemisia annua]